MLDPTQLFVYEGAIDARTIRARTLVITLGSYLDAGHSQRLIDEHLLNSLPNLQIGHFDIDQLFDYAGHRPQIVFDKDHFEQFDTPEITLRQLTDLGGEPFLLLSGPEPSLQWERMAAAVDDVVDRFSVDRVVLVQGFPAPTPHTRPVPVTRFASDPKLVPPESSLPATFQMSSSFTSLLAVRLGEQGREVIGLAAHVPHYLAGVDYPDAAIALLDEMREVSALEIPNGDLELLANLTRTQIDAQVEQSPELQGVISQLEQHYDKLAGERGLPVSAEDLPSADEIGAELEDFLRGLDGQDGKNGPTQPGFPPSAIPTERPDGTITPPESTTPPQANPDTDETDQGGQDTPPESGPTPTDGPVQGD